MPSGVFPRTKEHRRKIGLVHFGRKRRPETIARIKANHKGMLGLKHSKETRSKMSINHSRHMLGKHHTEESKNKMRKKLVGKIKSLEVRLKLSKALKGRKFSLEHRKNLSLSRVGKFFGKNNPNWLGGKSHEPYTVDWNATLKRSIRERDKYICQIIECQKPQGATAHHVHHIDYDKKNSNPNNLITLCRSCHTKTNFNREYWIKYFRNNP